MGETEQLLEVHCADLCWKMFDIDVNIKYVIAVLQFYIS